MGRRRNVLDEAVSALESLGISAVGFEGDGRKPEDAERVVEATVRHFGKLDILVNAAAGNCRGSLSQWVQNRPTYSRTSSNDKMVSDKGFVSLCNL